MSRQSVIGVDEVGLDKTLGWEIIADEPREIGTRFFSHAVHQVIVETVLRVEADVGLIPAHMAQVQPVIGERADEAIEVGVF